MSEREPAILGQPAGGSEVVARAPGAGDAAARRSEGPARVRGAAARAAPTYHAAGFWRRLGGGLVDLAVLIPVCLILTWLAGALSGVHLPASRHRGLDFWLDLLLASDPALLGGLGLSLAIGVVYAMVFQVTRARTLGMRLVRVRIIDLYGDPPSIGRAAARTAGYLAGLATLGLGLLWIGFDSERRGLHDYLAGTYVVDEER
ncbi:MAG TPA: RDD family protein [Kofleriaceae bacterium]|nr:RDD family protein [Kofleriaceae bacterium]